MFKFFSIGFFLSVIFVLLVGILFSGGSLFYGCSYSLLSNLLVVDSISFYFSLLVLFLGVYSQFIFVRDLSVDVRVFLFASLFFSSLSFFINHSILFWCVYELSMLPLLYLIFKESPYSERFLAGWYFSCYLLVTSLPLILLLLYISFVEDSFFFNSWTTINDYWCLVVMLAFVFFTKVPLVPFHTWLPIVHAEATSIVSIFLSGYIMKLGLLGVFRCCISIVKDYMLVYIMLALCLSVVFLITSCSELDGKRWLAFLSLAHIVVPFLSYFISDWCVINYSFFYCLGHGISAGLVFGLLWCFYDLCNSRNWIMLKHSIGGKFIMIFSCFSILSLCSFPPTIQFFCEVGLIGMSSGSMLYTIFWCMYLFFGSLVPLVLLGHLLVRSEFFENSNVGLFGFLVFFTFLCMWCYFGVLLI